MNIKLKGLDPEAVYEMTDESEEYRAEAIFMNAAPREPKTRFTGKALMNAGYTLPWAFGDYPAIQMHFRKIK